MNIELKPVRAACCLILVAMLTLAVTLPAAAQVESIDARARGTSTQMGKDFDIKITINQYSTAQDRQALKEAFEKGGHDALVKALSKMKGVGRIRIPSSTGYSIAYAMAIPTPNGRKLRFITDRPVAIFEQRNMTRSGQYDVTAGEIEINDQDKSKNAGVLYPAAQLIVNANGELQWELRTNPWKLTNIIDWTPKGKQ